MMDDCLYATACNRFFTRLLGRLPQNSQAGTQIANAQPGQTCKIDFNAGPTGVSRIKGRDDGRSRTRLAQGHDAREKTCWPVSKTHPSDYDHTPIQALEQALDETSAIVVE